ncbi:MAG: DUF3037 domain-containing protein [Bacteroidetes bacterium]|nr:DUF3037 domain-containing protein [Bacteroidota bacterium]MBS1630458.1 DUF3037 domain-containing protein [Bacteroidota bacterium]
MPAKDLFEYAVIRIVPRVEREEFINAGVILFCSRQRFLQARIALDEQRILAVCPHANLEIIKESLDSFKRISEGAKDAGPIALLELPARFRWLTAVRSTIVQTSRPHPGLCERAEKSLEELFVQLVG